MSEEKRKKILLGIMVLVGIYVFFIKGASKPSANEDGMLAAFASKALQTQKSKLYELTLDEKAKAQAKLNLVKERELLEQHLPQILQCEEKDFSNKFKVMYAAISKAAAKCDVEFKLTSRSPRLQTIKEVSNFKSFEFTAVLSASKDSRRCFSDFLTQIKKDKSLPLSLLYLRAEDRRGFRFVTRWGGLQATPDALLKEDKAKKETKKK